MHYKLSQHIQNKQVSYLLIFIFLLALFLTGEVRASAGQAVTAAPPRSGNPPTGAVIYLPVLSNNSVTTSQYVLLGWNDLGMHCYNRSFKDLAVLPPYNTLWAQVVKRGDPPQIVTQGVRVQYSFRDNKISTTKTDFWTYVAQLFGVSLPDNVGLKGKGLAGVMDVKTDHFEAVGIPLTEFSDSAPSTPDPFQLASLVAKDITSGATLASLTVVAPVSTEMHCDNCHASGKDPGGNQARTELNILALHDDEENTNLLNSRPVLCASCHSSNALGASGVNGVPSLSNSMHSQHAEEVPSTIDGCYNCHPGPTTRCLRDAMSQNITSQLDPNRKMNCIDCHGGMSKVAQNANPWLNEPRCDTCHTPTTTLQFNQNQALYRFSTGHGSIYCEACHDSTHAIATSREANDAIKFIQLQGHTGTLSNCTVCHLTQPSGPGPHAK